MGDAVPSQHSEFSEGGSEIAPLSSPHPLLGAPRRVLKFFTLYSSHLHPTRRIQTWGMRGRTTPCLCSSASKTGDAARASRPPVLIYQKSSIADREMKTSRPGCSRQHTHRQTDNVHLTATPSVFLFCKQDKTELFHTNLHLRHRLSGQHRFVHNAPPA